MELGEQHLMLLLLTYCEVSRPVKRPMAQMTWLCKLQLAHRPEVERAWTSVKSLLQGAHQLKEAEQCKNAFLHVNCSLALRNAREYPPSSGRY